MPPIDPLSFRHMLGQFATGITVITTRDKQGVMAGVTMNSFTSVSLDPPMILFCLEKKARSLAVFKGADHFAVNILGEKQEALSRAFATNNHPALSAKTYAPDVLGCPVLRGTLGWLAVRKVSTHQGGDHLIFVCEVMQMGKVNAKAQPLLYFRSHYRSLPPA